MFFLRFYIKSGQLVNWSIGQAVREIIFCILRCDVTWVSVLDLLVDVHCQAHDVIWTKNGYVEVKLRW